MFELISLCRRILWRAVMTGVSQCSLRNKKTTKRRAKRGRLAWELPPALRAPYGADGLLASCSPEAEVSAHRRADGGLTGEWSGLCSILPTCYVVFQVSGWLLRPPHNLSHQACPQHCCSAALQSFAIHFLASVARKHAQQVDWKPDCDEMADGWMDEYIAAVILVLIFLPLRYYRMVDSEVPRESPSKWKEEMRGIFAANCHSGSHKSGANRVQ